MVFSSMIFLWVFLPITLVIYNLVGSRLKNVVLLIASLIFYGWGEPTYIWLMIISITINYVFGILIHIFHSKTMMKLMLTVCVVINLLILGYFKYFNFFTDNLNTIMGYQAISPRNIILPIGISFYTFQALSYVVDFYRSKINGGSLKVQKNIFDLALYISLFPQLIAGPIVRYEDVEAQIEKRRVTAVGFAYGIRRFVYGLSKKIMISNTLASVADEIFKLNISDTSTTMAWLAVICYSLQIYFDFSGYSDMAVGLGHMFGFKFMENFNYPYIARSIQEFWRRWHISLSTWFKEYVYIPLGGNRKGNFRTYVNLLIVFFATGMWHGASWNFIVWGLFHGFFLVIERWQVAKVLNKNPIKLLNHLYTLLVVMIGWVFFRAETLWQAFAYIKIMFIPTEANLEYNASLFMNNKVILALVLGVLLSGLVQQLIKPLKYYLYEEKNIYALDIVLLMPLLALCILIVASGTYNPFIYFRF